MTRAAGPKGSFIWGSLPAFKADPIGFLADAAQDHGDVVRLRFGPITAHLINHPAYVEQILSRNAANYDKATRSAKRIAATTGDSLLSADQDKWQRHRRLIQPAFQPRSFDGIGPVLDGLITPMLARWLRDTEIDIVDEMMQLVIAAAVRILFSSDIDPQRINAPLEILLADTWRRIEAPLDASLISSRLHRPAFKQAVAEIDDIVLDLIKSRRASRDRPDDVLSRLLAAHEGEGAQQLSDAELRDAAVTLLLAGHETTANALSWAFIHATSGHGANPAHLFAEAIRLYPSIWIIERRVIRDDEVGGYHIPRGSSVLISPYLLHRHPDFWPDPETFDPTRFAQGTPRPREAYLPFGLGQHRCVGLHLAAKIAHHAIERVLAQVRLQPLPGQAPKPAPGMTLRHNGPFRMRCQRR
ncbi:cytochrome P450 [Pseudorhodobacter turbinis]|uniref:Cytochrome P450 n=1 Tax=Pseudorhodobacter turbinis TaxID=2500533 RepID=A0A4P8EE99_9RHOB|nr:cytochrome P450 [Pseudorhodobacter turbinis]QCO55082.1 cytochrome P450 [Pseudorhodobacter turbinis]